MALTLIEWLKKKKEECERDSFVPLWRDPEGARYYAEAIALLTPEPVEWEYGCHYEDWQTKKDINTMNMESVRELYDVEEKHPPLVGNRTQIAGSRRQLVHHFLDLPRHAQDEVAHALGLLNDGDGDILEDQWCGVLFQRAGQGGKLRGLWDEVEKRHEHGEPGKNPFVR